MLCRHCRSHLASRPRQLCRECYLDRSVRERYPSTSKYGRRGPGHFYGTTMLPPEPTRALPGTPEKVTVMAERAARRQSLFHPDDATLPDDARPVEEAAIRPMKRDGYSQRGLARVG